MSVVTQRIGPLRQASGGSGRAPRWFATSGFLVVMGYLTLGPLVFLLLGTFSDQNGLTLEVVREAYAAHALGDMVVNSLIFAGGSAALAVAIGTTLALLIERTDIPGKSLIFAASLAPLVVPGILHTVAWILLASPRIGVLNQLLEPIFGPQVLDVFTMGGMVAIEGLHLAPLVFLLMVAVLRSMDPSLEEAAFTSGARTYDVLKRVTLPLMRPALSAAAIIMTVRSLGAFEVPALVGMQGGVWVFTSRIWRALSGARADFGNAGAYAVALLGLTCLGIALHARLTRRRRAYQTVTSKGRRARTIRLGRWRRPAAVLLGLYLSITVVLPLLVLLYAATQPFYSVPSLASLSNMTLDNFREVLSLDQVLTATRNSVVLSIGTATLVMAATAVAAWLVVRSRIPGRWMIDGVASLPLAVPGLVIGVALLFVYLRSPVPVYGTLWLLLIAYVTRELPYGMRYSVASMLQVHSDLEESAQTSGASWLQTFRRVVLPLIAPGLAAGWIYLVIVSLRELSSSILLYSPGNEVLSILMWEQWQNGQFTQLAALAILMVAVLCVLLAVAYRWGLRPGAREL